MDEGWVRVYRNIPVVTRIYITACILLTFATNFEIVTQYQIYLNPTLVKERYQFWRVLTSFLYAGPFSFSTVFNILFTYRYSRILEEASFYRSSADYCFMFLFMGLVILILSLWLSDLIFLGSTFTHAILYIWCRRNPVQNVIIFGLLVIHADLVPFVLIGLSLVTGNPLASDLIAIAAGHSYYFLHDVFPLQPLGFRILKTPRFLKQLFNEVDPEIITYDETQGVDENNNLVNAGEQRPLMVNDANADFPGGNQFPLN